jgi:peptide-methionine (S)-S-oxide reductase
MVSRFGICGGGRRRSAHFPNMVPLLTASASPLHCDFMKFALLLPVFVLLGILTSPAVEAPSKPQSEKPKMEIATIAGGCFWCLETTLGRVVGVEKVISGYTGGKTKDPTYEEVCSGLTGHAEAVQITFDPSIISYEKILDVFFALHDPTTLNAQGGDHGTQYRSAIYYHDDAQKAAAEKSKKALDASGHYSKPAVTEITKLGVWYPAEAYHQNYFNEHMPKGTGNLGYLCNVVAPKVEKLKKLGIALKPNDPVKKK